MTLISASVHQREIVGGRAAIPDGLGVSYWLMGDAMCTGRASGRGLLHESSAGWRRDRSSRAGPPMACGHAHAPAALELVLQMIANRWKPSILLYLADGAQRRRDLERYLPRYVSAKVLTEQLRALETDGLVYRVDRTPAGHGRHVTYALTELGQTLGPAVRILAGWAVEHSADLLRGGRRAIRERDGER